jgi:hypothetical protein
MKAEISACWKERRALTDEDDHFAALREAVERKKAAIGWVDDEASTDGLRNSGKTRTPAKREMLARIENRAKAAGRPHLKSNY